MTITEKLKEALAAVGKTSRVLLEIQAEVEQIKQEELVTPEEYTSLMWELDGWPDITTQIHKHYKISSINLLPRREVLSVRNRIKEIKKTHENYISSEKD